jgi:superfamily I DNA/RNA helicase/RecB family exonuclease
MSVDRDTVGHMATTMSNTAGAPDLSVGPADWPGALAQATGPQIVVGGPGTGKTEFLVRRALHLVTREGVDSSRILALSFGRRSVADLDERLRRSLPAPSAPVAALTFHSLAAGIVEQHATGRGWLRPPQILTGPEQTALVRQLLAASPPGTWSPAFRQLLASTTFADEVTDFLLRASEQMLEPDDVAALAADRADWRGLPQFLVSYRTELRRRSRIDYGMLLSEAAAIAASVPDVATRHEFLLVDEYQDTTIAQVRLLQALATAHRNITVAADPYQSIYSFRGAAVQNVARFPEAFPERNGAPGRRIVLTTSFRTPAAILEAAVRVTSHELPGAAGPVRPAPGQGRVDVHVFEQQTAEAEWIAGEALRLHLETGLPFARMAVFVRSKRRLLPELSRALHRRRIPHDPPASRLAEQPAVRFVLDLVTAATGEELEALRAIRRILLGPWFSMPLGALRDVERTIRRDAVGWGTALCAADPQLAPLVELLSDDAWATADPAIRGVWQIWSSLPQLAAVATDDDRRSERSAWASLTQVLSRWNERNPRGTLADYQRLVESEEFEARPLLSYTMPAEDRLTVTTLHQAKGLEFDIVFIADAVEGVFPDLRLRDSLLGVRHLLPDVPEDSAAYRRFRLQEERRLAYTAMTRAGRRVVWTATSTGFEEGHGVPSRFLALVAGTDTVDEAATKPDADRPPVTAAEAQALLRRHAADPSKPGSLRLAAIDALARGSRWNLGDPWTFGGVRPAGPDTGLVAPGLRLSPSQADAYAECPRRYVLTRRLGIGDAAGPHAALGRLVHRVLEIVEREAIDRSEPHGTLDAALLALGDTFDAEAFGGEPFATAWLRRAQVILESLYGRWPGKGTVVAVEHRLTAEIDGVPWIGYIDRVERQGDGLRIVDYKTSSQAMTKAAAAESLQLGFYLLAAADDPALSAVGTPVAAEAWYPYASRKQKSVSVRPFEPSNLGGVADQLTRAAEGIRAERWLPVPSAACERCPVRTVCPAQPEGREGFMP